MDERKRRNKVEKRMNIFDAIISTLSIKDISKFELSYMNFKNSKLYPKIRNSFYY